MSEVKVNKISPRSGTAFTLGDSGDTFTVPSGAGLTLTDSTLLLPTTINTDKLDPKSGTALEIGSSGDTITVPSGATIVNSGTATGFGGGLVLQVVTGTTTTKVTNSTNVFADTGLTVNITPASSSNKVLIMGTQSNCFKSVDSAATSMHLRLLRDSTEVLDIADRILLTDTTLEQAQNASFHCLDSPSSTSELTYKTQFRNHADLASVSVQNEVTGKSTIIAMEISG